MALRRLDWIAAALDFIPPEMSGFRRHRATADCLADVIATLEDAQQRGYAGYLVLLDVKSAFDNLPHDSIMDALRAIRVCDRVFAYVSAFLSGRCFRVRVGGSTSSPRSISVDVPQGSVLSPFLSNLALARLPDFIPRTLPCDVRLAIYADDLSLFAVGPTSSGRLVRQSIQGAINAIDSYLPGIGLNLSPNKTEALLVHLLFRVRYEIPRLNLRGVLIPWSRRVRYLGVLIDHRLSWKPAVAALRKGSTKVANAARSLLARGRGCSPQLALRVYNTVATSRCLYGLPLASLRPSQWETLDMQHRQVIRQLYGLPRNSPIGPTLAEAKDFPLSVRAQCRALNHAERRQRTRQGQYLVLRLHYLPHSCMGRRAAEFHTLVPTPYYGWLPPTPHHPATTNDELA
ncbi:hypothetical protein HPB49_005571 [Dermacentor silvarum]|uniref:Uncharacterized protein n=1 Tax=Dermacentor silvarum TaxID=543639 RepID=A0ACB8D3A8_DERSI|nr:hypothetical protein HPB49_005571 [Dermacentor silvarum]